MIVLRYTSTLNACVVTIWINQQMSSFLINSLCKIIIKIKTKTLVVLLSKINISHEFLQRMHPLLYTNYSTLPWLTCVITTNSNDKANGTLYFSTAQQSYQTYSYNYMRVAEKYYYNFTENIMLKVITLGKLLRLCTKMVNFKVTRH